MFVLSFVFVLTNASTAYKSHTVQAWDSITDGGLPAEKEQPLHFGAQLQVSQQSCGACWLSLILDLAVVLLPCCFAEACCMYVWKPFSRTPFSVTYTDHSSSGCCSHVCAALGICC